MDPASAFGLHFLMQEVSVPLLLTVCLFFYSLLESSAADGRRRHHLRLLLVPQDELFGARHVLVSWTWSFSNYSLSLSLQVHLGDGEMCIHWKSTGLCFVSVSNLGWLDRVPGEFVGFSLCCSVSNRLSECRRFCCSLVSHSLIPEVCAAVVEAGCLQGGKL